MEKFNLQELIANCKPSARKPVNDKCPHCFKQLFIYRTNEKIYKVCENNICYYYYVSKNESEYIRSRDFKEVSTEFSLKQLIKEIFCSHYWVAQKGDPTRYIKFLAKCDKCCKYDMIYGIYLDEIIKVGQDIFY